MCYSADDMPKSLRKEILRKLVHLLEIPVLLIYSLVRFYSTERAAILTVTAMFLVLLEVEYYRLEVKPKIPKHLNILRPRERNNVVSSIFFVAATIIVFAVFDYGIALTALCLTVFGDLASALVGIRFGKNKLFRNKTLEGFLAGLAVNLLIGWLLIPGYAAVYISMALVASVVELFTGKLDDNLTVPLFAGFVGHLVTLVLQINLSAFPGPLDWLFKFL